uniref:Secreted protein n=1 Tax=Parascaris univalens TaxID=6257 RepID=A0A915A7G9_PARUN
MCIAGNGLTIGTNKQNCPSNIENGGFKLLLEHRFSFDPLAWCFYNLTKTVPNLCTLIIFSSFGLPSVLHLNVRLLSFHHITAVTAALRPFTAVASLPIRICMVRAAYSSALLVTPVVATCRDIE